MTASYVYQLPGSQGCIAARPQPGYYVAPQVIKIPKTLVTPVTRDEVADINAYILDILQAGRGSLVAPSTSAFSDL